MPEQTTVSASLASDLDAACLRLMEAMETLVLQVEALTAPAAKGRGATIEVARYAADAGGSAPAVLLKPNGYCPILNDVALGDLHKVDSRVRSIVRPHHGLPDLDPHRITALHAAGREVEAAFAGLEAVVSAEIGGVQLSFQVSAMGGVTRLDEACWSALPVVIEVDTKPGFLAAAKAILRLTACLKAVAPASESDQVDDFCHVFRRPLRRSWPVEIRKNRLYGYLASEPEVDAPDEATARAMIDIAIDTVALHGHRIEASHGRDTYKLEAVN